MNGDIDIVRDLVREILESKEVFDSYNFHRFSWEPVKNIGSVIGDFKLSDEAKKNTIKIIKHISINLLNSDIDDTVYLYQPGAESQIYDVVSRKVPKWDDEVVGLGLISRNDFDSRSFFDSGRMYRTFLYDNIGEFRILVAHQRPPFMTLAPIMFTTRTYIDRWRIFRGDFPGEDIFDFMERERNT